MSIAFRATNDRPSPWLRILVILSTAWWMCTGPAYAECVAFGPWALKWDGIEFVFDGTVLALTDVGGVPVAQMQVHRVFRGTLPARIELYAWPSMEHPTITSGQRYVLAISRMRLEGFATLAPDLVYGTVGCGGGLRANVNLDGFGPGWPPKG